MLDGVIAPVPVGAAPALPVGKGADAPAAALEAGGMGLAVPGTRLGLGEAAPAAAELTGTAVSVKVVNWTAGKVAIVGPLSPVTETVTAGTEEGTVATVMVEGTPVKTPGFEPT